MMIKETINYPSADGKTMIYGTIWKPEGEVKAVVQIVHGMVEYIDRYEDFALFLTQNGYVVAGEDHLGHGRSVVSEAEHGFLGKNGNTNIIADIHTLRTKLEDEYKGVPHIMLGHSWGSFLTREYITWDNSEYSKNLAGTIIMGTGWQAPAMLVAGKSIAKLIGLVKGERKYSKLIEAIAFGSYLKRIENPKSVSDWLSKDREVVKAYRKDPWCTFHFTINAYYNMFKGMQLAHDKKRMRTLPASLPLLIVSGAEDPVGGWGEGVRKAFVAYSENTECQVDIKLYDDDRHEILNETDKDVVYSDLLEWLDCCVLDHTEGGVEDRK